LLGNNQLNVACVGASVPLRDSWDARMIAEMNGTGTNPVLDSAEVGIRPRIGPIWMSGDSMLNRFYEPGVDWACPVWAAPVLGRKYRSALWANWWRNCRVVWCVSGLCLSLTGKLAGHESSCTRYFI